GPSQAEAGREVHLERLIPDLIRETGERHRRERRGVVEEDIDPPHRLHRARREARDLVPAAEIDYDVANAAREPLSDLIHRRRQLRFVTTRDDDIGAGLGETARHRFAEAAAASRDESHTPREIEQSPD